MTKLKKPVEVFTDGSIKNNGLAGFGIVMLFGEKIKKVKSLSYQKTTIQRMELKAIIASLEQLNTGYDIYIYSDNKMIVDTINRRLVEWIELGVLDQKKNPGLWRRFLKARRKHLESGSFILVSWIRGHAGNKYNEIADQLATAAARNKKKVKCNDRN